MPDSVQATQRGFFRGLNSLWGVITEPSKSITDPIQRFRARLIITTIAILHILITISLFAQSDMSPFVLIVLTIGYFLSRTKYYRLSAFLVIANISFFTLYALPDPNEMNRATIFMTIAWFTPSLILAGLIFNFRQMLVVSIVHFLIPLSILYFYPQLEFRTIIVSIGYIIVVTSMILVNMRLRNLLELERHKEIRKLKDFHENIVKGVGETIFIEDENGLLSFINPRTEDLLGYKSEELIGKHWSTLVPESQRGKVSDESSTRPEGKESQYETILLNKEGEEVPVIASARPIFEEGEFVGVISAFTDITDRKNAEAQLLFDALHDGLTGLPNRVLFDDRLTHVIARANRHKDYNYAVLFMDLDRFKVINDSLGHSLGDELLISVGQRLSQCVRSVDTVARFGGDEYVILLDDISGMGEALLIVNRIQSELRKPFRIHDHTVFTTASIGIVTNSEECHSPEDIIRDADTAMYRAKTYGKDRLEIFDSEMRRDALTRMKIESELRLAFDDGDLRVYYQPLISTTTNRIVGLEALLRWQHQERGLLLPGEFLDIAEETGLTLPIGKWVLQEACLLAKRIQDKFNFSPPPFISVNLSRKQFFNPELPLDISHAVQDTHLEADYLKLEICEDVIMEDTEKTIDIIQLIRDTGAGIHMDDFGIGYSSLATLHRFPIEALKIPGEFIGKTAPGMNSYDVAGTIISLAKKLNISVIAEGVETPQQLDFLRKESCEIWQGHLCSKAMSADALDIFLSKASAE